MGTHKFEILLTTLLVFSFLVGAIPFAYLFAKRLKGIDIRKVGSGNVGATNASRVLGKPIGFLILILDALKGSFPVLVGSAILFHDYPWTLSEPRPQLIAFCIGIAAFLGHCFNPFLRFKGGKGVATGLGVFLMLAPYAALVTFAVCITMIITTRLVSLASITGAILLPILIIVFAHAQGLPRIPWTIVGLTVILSALVILRHRSNIKRLLAGMESKA